MDVLCAATADALNEICEVVTRRFARRPGLNLIGYPRLIGVITIDGEIAVRAIKDVANGVRLRVLRTEGSLRIGWLLVRVRAKSRCWHCGVAVCASADLRLVIGDPGPHLQFQQLALAVRTIEVESGVQCVWRFLIIIEEEFSSHCGDANREP